MSYLNLSRLRSKVEHIFRMGITTWTILHTNSSSQTSCWAKLSTDLENTSLEFLTIEMLLSLTKSTLIIFKVETENQIKSEGRLQLIFNNY